MSDAQLRGSCFCGAIHYLVTGVPRHETNCHCETCRRTTGAPSVAWFTVDRHTFHVTAGTPTRFASSTTGTRSFCGRCGTQLTFEREELPREIDVTTCSLDDAARVPPRDHTFADQRPAWVRLGDGLPAFPRARED